jgi:hypothetical protein
MTIQVVVSTVFFLIGIGCMLRANLLFREIVAEINLQLPNERAIPVTGFVRYRFFEAICEYRKLYPDGKLVLGLSIWSTIGFLCLFGAAGYWFFSGAASTGYIRRNR